MTNAPLSGKPQAAPRQPRETELFERWQSQRDQRAREELVRLHLLLARKLAGRYARTGEPMDDLFQVASLGLVKAIDRFDTTRGVGFASFAVPTILGELKRHFRDTGWSVHVPRRLQEHILKVQEAEIELSARTGRSPSVLDIARYLELSSEQVLEALEAVPAHRAASLDAPIHERVDDAWSTYDLIGVEDEQFAMFESRATLAAAIAELSEADQRVLSLRFRDELTQREIAGQIGVSQMQVSRILRRIRGELRIAMSVEPGP
jgi:RNA polymerase sigma-B factor